MTAHPRDVWIDVTRLGDATPQFVLAVDGREAEIAEAKEHYVHDRMTLADFEARVAEVLRT